MPHFNNSIKTSEIWLSPCVDPLIATFLYSAHLDEMDEMDNMDDMDYEHKLQGPRERDRHGRMHAVV